MRALPEALGPHYASNNWVVDGAHTTSGKPLLANDPHLGFATPGFWYLARLKTPEHDIEGGTAAGTPLVIIGHNEKIAWGFTTTTADIEDLFIEKLDPEESWASTWSPTALSAFRTRQETITVTRRRARHAHRTRHAAWPRGLRHAAAGSTIDTGFMSWPLQASFLDDDDGSAEALWDIDRATDWTGFPRGSPPDISSAPPQNIVYADTGGTIGFEDCRRPHPDPQKRATAGCRRRDGAATTTGRAWCRSTSCSQATNPASGHFVSANTKIVPDSYPYFISRDWDVLPDRAQLDRRERY